MIPGKSREENIEAIQQVLGVTEDRAEFIYAIESGEIDGDALNQDGIDEFKGNSIEDTAEAE